MRERLTGFVQEDKDATMTVEHSIFNHDVNTDSHFRGDPVPFSKNIFLIKRKNGRPVIFFFQTIHNF